MYCHIFILDGDNFKHKLYKDLGFTELDRIENFCRTGQMEKLMSDSGVIVNTSFIPPFNYDREMIRNMILLGEFI